MLRIQTGGRQTSWLFTIELWATENNISWIRSRALTRALITRSRSLHWGYLLHSQLQYHSSYTNRILCFFLIANILQLHMIYTISFFPFMHKISYSHYLIW